MYSHKIRSNYEMFIFNNKIFIWAQDKNLFMSENFSTNVFKKLTKKNYFSIILENIITLKQIVIRMI